jgi:hypothetical protein
VKNRIIHNYNSKVKNRSLYIMTNNKLLEHIPLWSLGIITGSYTIIPFLYYLFRQNNLKLIDFYVMSAILVFLVVGGYQLYFYPQRYYKNKPHKKIYEIPETVVDRYIPKITWTVYIYNFLYYFSFGVLLIFIKSYKEFVYLCFRALLLLVSLFVFFMLIPNKLHESTRDTNETNHFLKLTQSCDDLMNAFPSAHVAIAVFIAFEMKKYIGNIAYIFPLVIAASCLCTKQHYFIDCVGGGIWGTVYSLLMI